MPKRLKLHGLRYMDRRNEDLARFILDDLPYLDFKTACDFYVKVAEDKSFSYRDIALLACNDRYFLLTAILKRGDAVHPWLFARCREVEAEPNGYLDLWSRFHYKSTIITFAGSIQGIIRDPEITIGIFSASNKIAKPFLNQLKQEMEQNDLLKKCFPDVFWEHPRKQAPSWSLDVGLTVRRKSNPKEKTIEAFGVLDGMPTGRHFKRLVFDDMLNHEHVGNPEIVAKVTERWELAQNLGVGEATERQAAGTRYSFADSYASIIDLKTLKARVYPATEDGTLDGKPVFLSQKHWEEIKKGQRGTVAAQMLQNPIAGKENMFMPQWFRPWEVRPGIMTIYILVDPSSGGRAGSGKGKAKTDRTAMAVVGIDDRGNKYLLDGYRHRMALSERWAALRNLWRKWSEMRGVSAVFVGYERYGMQSDLEYIEERQRAEKCQFGIKEVAWVSEGGQSKKDRVGRLEPDFRNGRFYLPAVVYGEATFEEGKKAWSGDCLWRVDEKAGRLMKRPMVKLPQTMATMKAAGNEHRIAKAIRRLDEDGKIYDVTLSLIDEMTYFPFAPKDDLVDAVSRIYDMEPARPIMGEEPASVELLEEDFEDA